MRWYAENPTFKAKVVFFFFLNKLNPKEVDYKVYGAGKNTMLEE